MITIIIVSIIVGIVIGVGGFIGLLRLLATDSSFVFFIFIGAVVFSTSAPCIMLHILFSS